MVAPPRGRRVAWRCFHALAYDVARARVVLFGGSTTTSALDDTWQWDGDAWTLLRPAVRPPARHSHAMAYDVARQRVVLFGGYDHGGRYLADTWEWDGLVWWQRLSAQLPAARGQAAMAYDVARQRTVLFGGAWWGGRAADTWEWDGTAWTQRFPAMVPPDRSRHSMAYDTARGVVVLVGGDQQSGPGSDVWQWDGTNWSLRTSAGVPGQVGHAAAYDLARGRTVILGAQGAFAWDGAAWTAQPAPLEVGLRRGAAAATDTGRDRVVLYGGYRGSFGFPLAETWEWDGVSWLQRAPARSPPALGEHAMAFDPTRGLTVLFGGSDCGGSKMRCPVGDTWLWDGSTWSPVNVAPSPPARAIHAMAFDAARSRVVLFGGIGVGTVLADTWEWDGAAWLQRQPANSPAARGHHAMAYDPVRQRVVLFGGHPFLLGPPLGDTWEWDGSNWLSRSPLASPPPRSRHSLAYHAARRRVVLFGGTDFQRDFNDTWEWDGTTWTAINVPPAPSPRADAVLAYHVRGQELLLVTGGGVRATWNTVQDSWRYGDLRPSSTAQMGRGCAGTRGVPLLASNEPYVGNPRFLLELSAARPAAPIVLGIAGQTQALAIGPCTLYLRDPIVTLAAVTNNFGTLAVALAIPRVASLRGASVFAQAFVLDAQASLGLAFSAARTLRLGD